MLLMFCNRVGTLLLLFSAFRAQAVDISDSTLVAKINAIHEDASSRPADKIVLFKRLQVKLFQSNHSKNAAYALLVHRLGDAYNKAGDPEKAMLYTKEAVAVNASGKPGTDPSFLVNSYFNLGIFYKRLYLFKEAHYYFARCIAFGVKYPNKHFIAFMAFEQRAYTFYQTGDYQRAIQEADEGLRFAAAVNNENSRAALLAQRAQSASELLRFEEAERDVNLAISLLESSANDPVHLATCYSVYGAILSKIRRYNMAIGYYQKAFELNKANGNFEQCARDMQDMGCVYADELKQDRNALACYEEGIKLAREVGDVYQLSALYANIGIVYSYKKRYTPALKYYQKALNILPLNFNDTSFNANPDLQQLKLVANDYFMVTILSNKGNALLERYKQTGQRGDLTLALATFELADQSLDMMRWKQSGLESKLIWRKNTREMYTRCVEACFQLKSVEKAYYFLEKSRAALLTDQLNLAAAETVLSETERNTEKQLRVSANILSEKLLDRTANGADYIELKERWLNAQEKWEKYIKALENKHPAFYHYKYDRSVCSYTDVKLRVTKTESSFVSYFEGDGVIYALLISANKQKLLKIRYPQHKKDSQSIVEFCASPARLNQDFSAYRKLAFRLYNNLFKPLDVRTASVIVSQDECFIPFEALITDTASASAYLAGKHAFSYVPTFSILKKKKTGFTRRHFLGIAPLKYHSQPGLSDLEGSDLSLGRISKEFGHALMLIGQAASKAAFLENAGRHAVVQLYAHADASSYSVGAQKLKEPVLYLNDAPLHLSDIQQMDFKYTKLVVLSACNTGIGRYATGEGVFSMARGFMAAGVPASITNLWQVDDQATYRLTESFYSHLNEGLPKDVALNAAKLDLMSDQDQMYTLPYYWAASILIGDAEAIVPKNNLSFYLWLAGFVLIIAGGLFFWLKRKK